MIQRITTTESTLGESNGADIMQELISKPYKSPKEALSGQLGVTPDELMAGLHKFVMPKDSTKSDYDVFMQVAAKYGLNPFTREIFAMINKGKMQVVVPIDGWVKLVQRHKDYDGCAFEEVADDNGVKPEVTFCTIYRKSQSHAVRVPERFAECVRGTEPWSQMPFRMLRHKAFIQCARIAFGISGISDQDEAADALGMTPEQAAAQIATQGKAAKEKPAKSELDDFNETPTTASTEGAMDSTGGQTKGADVHDASHLPASVAQGATSGPSAPQAAPVQAASSGPAPAADAANAREWSEQATSEDVRKYVLVLCKPGIRDAVSAKLGYSLASMETTDADYENKLRALGYACKVAMSNVKKGK